MLPKDPIMLLSFVNMKLRDFDENLEEFCKRQDVAQEEIEAKLKQIGYQYDPAQNQFR